MVCTRCLLMSFWSIFFTDRLNISVYVCVYVYIHIFTYMYFFLYWNTVDMQYYVLGILPSDLTFVYIMKWTPWLIYWLTFPIQSSFYVIEYIYFFLKHKFTLIFLTQIYQVSSTTKTFFYMNREDIVMFPLDRYFIWNTLNEMYFISLLEMKMLN